MAGIILHEGVSALDGVSPVALIVTRGSKNTKTGDMDQAWIIRTDVHPLVATRKDLDGAICGDCRHRTPGARSCYVVVGFAPAGVYRAYKAGVYRAGTPDDLSGRFLRMAAYGDPAAIPLDVWTSVVSKLSGWTGYTHQWKTVDSAYKNFLMASVDTEAEFDEARRAGWRTFRVRQTPGLLDGEIVCPASAEAGHRTTCQRCRLCSGAGVGQGSARSIAIYAHGSGKTSAFFKSAQIPLVLTD
jgi:hypothetical protein